MPQPKIFFRLLKIDIARREVSGIATEEVVDASGEICDYETTKPYFQAWSDGVKKASGGKSLGNVREMHSNIAAGKITDLIFNDADKSIVVVTKCVDDSTWNKITEGVLTGFSQGGDYVKRWKDGEFMRFTANPSEISYVDLPCVPTATFEVIKADGSTEMRKFAPKAEPLRGQVWCADDGSVHKTKAEMLAKNSEIEAKAVAAKAAGSAEAILNDIEDALNKREFTDEERAAAAKSGEAMEDGSFPIKSEQDLKNAIRAVGRATDPAKAKDHIKTRAKAMGLESELPDDWKDESSEKSRRTKFIKGLYEAARIAAIVEELSWLHGSLECEEAWEDDGSPQPDALAAIVKQLCDFLPKLVEEECSEIVEDKGGTGIEMPMEMSRGHISALKKFIESKYTSEEAAKFLERLEKIALKKEDMEMGAGMMDHLNAIHKAAGHIMKKCMKCMGSDAEKILKSKDDSGDEKTEHLKSIHKKAADIAHRAVQMGSEADDDQGAADDGDDDSNEKMLKVAAENGELKKSLATLTTQLTEIASRLKKVEDQPAARKGAAMVILNKGHDRTEEPETTDDEPRNFNMNGLSPAEARSLTQSQPQRR